MNLQEMFEKHIDTEYIKFERIECPQHPRPDICAFLMLSQLVPDDGRDMVTSAEHDEIYLDTDCTKLAEVISEAQVIDLLRCGVRYDAGADGLCMFV